jgi:hypothetical protein
MKRKVCKLEYENESKLNAEVKSEVVRCESYFQSIIDSFMPQIVTAIELFMGLENENVG